MADLEPLRGRVEVEVGGGVNELERLAASLERIESTPDIDDKGLNEVEKAGKKAADSAKNLDKALDGIDSKEAQAAANALEREFDEAAKAAISDLDEIEAKMRELGRQTIDVDGGGATGGLADRIAAVAPALLALETGRRVLETIVEQTTEAERAMTLLSQAANSASNNTGKNVEQLAAFAKQLEGTFVQTKEEIAGVEAGLLKFENIGGEVFDRTTKGVLDLSLALGKGLPEGLNLLGGALNDPLTKLDALADAGITFTQVQKDQIKALVESGRQLEAQNIILQAVENRFKGASEAAAKDFGGAMAKAQDAVGDLAEALGEGGLGEALKGVAEDIQAIAGEGSTLKTVATGLGAVLGTVVVSLSTGFRSILGLFKLVSAGIEVVVGGITGGLARIPLFMASVADSLGQVDLAKKLRDIAEPIKDYSDALIAGAGETFQQGLDDIGSASEAGWERLKKIWGEGADGLADQAVPKVQQAVDKLGNAAEGLSANAAKHLENFRSTWREGLTVIEQDTLDKALAISRVFETIDPGEINLLPADVKEKLKADFAEAIEIIRQAGLPISQAMQNVGNAIGVLVAQTTGIPKAVAGAGGALLPLGANLKALADAAGPAGQAVGEAGGQIETAGGEIIKVGDQAAAAAKSMAKGLDDVASSAQKVVGPAAEAGGTITRASGEIISIGPATQTAGGQVKEGLDDAAKGFNAVADAAGSAGSGVADGAGQVATAIDDTADAAGKMQEAASDATAAGSQIANSAADAATSADKAATAANSAADKTGAETAGRLADLAAKLTELEGQIAGVGDKPLVIKVDLAGFDEAITKFDALPAKIASLPASIKAALAEVNALLDETKGKADACATALANVDAKATEVAA